VLFRVVGRFWACLCLKTETLVRETPSDVSPWWTWDCTKKAEAGSPRLLVHPWVDFEVATGLSSCGGGTLFEIVQEANRDKKVPRFQLTGDGG